MELIKSERFEQIANEVISKHKDEFNYLMNGNYRIAYLESSQEKKEKGLVIHADTALVADKYKWTCPYDFVITFYLPNIEYMDDEQLQILTYHELKHIGADKDKPYIVEHDFYYADFNSIVTKYGKDWSNPR